jgi:hypothetical protein
VAQEGAFGTLLLERDVCDPPLMFGASGVLDVATYPRSNGPASTSPSEFTSSPWRSAKTSGGAVGCHHGGQP